MLKKVSQEGIRQNRNSQLCHSQIAKFHSAQVFWRLPQQNLSVRQPLLKTMTTLIFQADMPKAQEKKYPVTGCQYSK